ncbi:MAG: thiamine phosphate synthase [Ginsengibacter sp.]
MLVVISYPGAVKDEANIVNTLFDVGLEILHVRKPYTDVDELRVLIEKIHSKYQNQIALHQHHEIANDYGIKRLHLTEAKRKEMSEGALKALREDKYILSTSIHQIEVYETLPACFEYTFFGPVFNSISKQGYTSSLKKDFVFPEKYNFPKVIAIGGIDAGNIQKVMNMKFKGIAVLGTIWQNPETSIQQFKLIDKTWKQVNQ